MAVGVVLATIGVIDGTVKMKIEIRNKLETEYFRQANSVRL